MIQTDVIIVGGGPAGSACAWRLRQLGVACLVIDQARFPRFKPCAGWITPQVVQDIALDPQEYIAGADGKRSFTTFTASQLSIFGLHLKLPSNQHAIRRIEFDDWLLKRSGAPVYEHTVKSITRDAGDTIIDGEFRAKYLVGAGGTHCPVYRSFFKPAQAHPNEALIVAQEEEFLYPHSSTECWLWFFENRLPGYAWFVPKANGYVNVGIGGKIERLKARNDNLKEHWNRFVQKLDQMGLVRGHTYKPSGHSYYLRESAVEPRRENVFLVGDAAGLATLDMGEGIGPAVRSGMRAAEVIARGGEYRLDGIARYSEWTGGLLAWAMNR
jgi:geranylgeranyl reductase family protein